MQDYNYLILFSEFLLHLINIFLNILFYLHKLRIISLKAMDNQQVRELNQK